MGLIQPEKEEKWKRGKIQGVRKRPLNWKPRKDKAFRG